MALVCQGKGRVKGLLHETQSCKSLIYLGFPVPLGSSGWSSVAQVHVVLLGPALRPCQRNVPCITHGPSLVYCTARPKNIKRPNPSLRGSGIV
jgi:hypothetical protein